MSSETSRTSKKPFGGFKWYHWLIVAFLVLWSLVDGLASGGAYAIGSAIGTLLFGTLLVAIGRVLWHGTVGK